MSLLFDSTIPKKHTNITIVAQDKDEVEKLRALALDEFSRVRYGEALGEIKVVMVPKGSTTGAYYFKKVNRLVHKY